SPPASNDDFLNGVTATSASNAWAVGLSVVNRVDRTLIMRLQGGAWHLVTSPNAGAPDQDNRLNAVRATSAQDAWAVGFVRSSMTNLPLPLPWDGLSWQPVDTPGLPAGRDAVLTGVGASSPRDVWAVGSISQGDGPDHALILHWNGTSWKRMTVPDPA